MHRCRPRLAGSIVLLVTAAGAVAGCGSSDTADTSDAADASPTYLLSLTGDAATLAGGDDGRLTLTLEGTDAHTVWFTDRPQRDSGVFGTDDLAAFWEPGGGFDTDPPNVALVLHEPAGATDTVVAVMQEPTYDAATATLTVDLDVLTAEEADGLDGALAGHGDRHDGATPEGSVGAVSLFIDSLLAIVP